MQQLGIADEDQARRDAILLDLGAEPGRHEALAIRHERASARPLRHDRPAQQDLAGASIAVLLAKPRLDEHGAVAILADLDGPERKRGMYRARLAAKHNACEIPERIKIEEKRSRAER